MSSLVCISIGLCLGLPLLTILGINYTMFISQRGRNWDNHMQVLEMGFKTHQVSQGLDSHKLCDFGLLLST